MWKGSFYIRSMTSPDMTKILEELAAGRIDAAEAASRIDALKAGEPSDRSTPDETAEPVDVPEVTAEPSNEELAAAQATGSDPWAAETDRPQRATHTSESFLPPQAPEPTRASDPAPEPATDPEPVTEPVRPKPVNTSGVERISVRAVGRRVRIVAETSVATLSADGPHVLRRNGAVLEVSSD